MVVCVLSCVQLFVTHGSPVHGIFQARILEWVVISCFRVASQLRDWTHFSRVFCIRRGVLYRRATWEARHKLYRVIKINWDQSQDGFPVSSPWAAESESASVTQVERSPGGSELEKLPASAGDRRGLHPRPGRPLEKEAASRSSILASLVAQLVKSPTAVQEAPVWFLGPKDALKKG